MLTDKHDPIPDCDCQACALAERDKLRAEVTELDALHDRLADLLTRTAVALRGPQPAMGRHSWHDLPERAAAAIAAIALVQAVERSVRPTLPERGDSDAPICPWCDRHGWDTCQHADDARTCGK